MALKTRPCTRCDGGGLVANTDTREPWSAWTSLPPGSDLAVQLGIVQPEDCDECDGKGTVPVEPTPQQVLDLALDPSNDSGADSVRGYLIALLGQLWHHGEDYVKRPFGNSGWQDDLYKPLVKAGYLPGTFDEDGDLDDIDYRAGERVIVAAIKALAKAPAPPKPGDLVAGDAGTTFGFIVGTLVQDEIFTGLGHAAIRVEGEATPYAVDPATLHVLKAGER